MKRDFFHDNKSGDLASRIAALPQAKRALVGQSLTRKLVDGHTLLAQSLKRLGITRGCKGFGEESDALGDTLRRYG